MQLSSIYSDRFWQGNYLLTKHSVVISLITCGLSFLIVYTSIIVNGIANTLAPLVLVAAVPLLLVAWRDWESGIKILLVILIIEGAIRKWFLPTASEFVYFYKDFLMIVIIFSYLGKKRLPPLLVKHQLKLLLAILFIFILYVIALITNPRLPHPLIGLLGLKVYLLYMPLAFLVPRMFISKEKLIAFLRWYLIISLFVAALCAVQFVDSNPNSSLNRYAWDEQTMESAVVGMDIDRFQDSSENDFVRVTGPFSYISGLTIYLPTTFALLLGLVSQRTIGPLPKGFRWVYHIALAIVVGATFMTGSRAAVLNLCITVLIFYGIALKKDLLRRVKEAVVGSILIFITLNVFFPQAYNALHTRTFDGEERISEGWGRIEEVFQLPIDEAVFAGAFGYGVGATQNAVPILMNKLNLPFLGEQIPIYYESEPGRLMLELGVVGYILHLILRFGIFFSLLYTCSSIHDPGSKSLAVAAIVALLFPLFVGGAVANHTQNVYQWFLVGIPIAMLNAEKLSALRIHDRGRLILTKAIE